MNRLKWAGIYVLTFVVAFATAIVVPRLFPGNFAGIETVHWDSSVGTAHTDLRYGDKPLNTFDLYTPAGERKDSNKLVVYLHAGGFTGGDKADDASIAHSFTAKGYVTATVNYSLRADSNDVTVNEESLEIKQSIAAIKDEAAKLGYDLTDMVIAGGSAGGALAMIYAYRDAPESPIPVRAVISMVGPASFEPAAWFGFDKGYQDPEQAKAAAGFVTIITGKDVTAAQMRDGSYRQYLRPVTAADLVNEDSVPSLVAYGQLDKVAPYAASREFVQKLDKLDIPHDAIIFPNSGHALNRDADKNDLLGKKINQYLDRYLPIKP